MLPDLVLLLYGVVAVENIAGVAHRTAGKVGQSFLCPTKITTFTSHTLLKESERAAKATELKRKDGGGASASGPATPAPPQTPKSQTGEAADGLDETETPRHGLPSYVNARAGPAKRASTPPLCAVCGLVAPYTCIFCGDRYCSLPCQAHHSETR